ncbi:Ankyrin repeat-containing domain protein [Nannochloropsis gaditana]|uniref:Ankyrin repeat-containing domain protein n=1 Tax=Nannochloropsis gaditana TaxID=72520 RepID=W7TVU5_9STRA|nr:Ankyrin repeat-containing domain protein [Nannochloropsis gaditana]
MLSIDHPATSVLLERVLASNAIKEYDTAAIISRLTSSPPISLDEVNYQDEQGRSPLGVAVTREGQSDLVKALVEEGNASLGLRDARLRTPLLLASEFNQTSNVLYLLKKLQAQNNKWRLADERDCFRRGPLHYMCKHWNVEGVQALVSVARAQASDVQNPENGNSSSVLSLLVNEKTSSGETPLFWLAQSIADTNKKSKEKRFERAEAHDHTDEAVAHCHDDKASTNDILEIARLLVGAGAEPRAGNALGQSPATLVNQMRARAKEGRVEELKEGLQALFLAAEGKCEDEEAWEVKKEDVRGASGVAVEASRDSPTGSSSTLPGVSQGPQPCRNSLASLPARREGSSATLSPGGVGLVRALGGQTNGRQGAAGGGRGPGGAVGKKLRIKMRAPTGEQDAKQDRI